MTDERFAELVHQLQSQAEKNPRGYKLRVAGLASLGFFYIAGVLAILVAAMGGIVWAYVYGTGRTALRRAGTAIGLLIFAIGRAMWVKFDRPEGIEIRKQDAPELFSVVEAVRKKMHAPRVHRVLIESDFNAAVSQTPRLGVLGWQENTLFLGLPLLQALSPDQALAVLAHEFGHLSGSHSRFGGWIYRVRAMWDRLLAKLEEEEHWSSFVFRPFFRWYAPYFNAYTFVLARANEYEADAAGAEITSTRAAADALISVKLKNTFLDYRFWSWVGSQAEVRPEPDVAPYSRMAKLLPGAPESEDAEHWLPQYLDQETDLTDTHPSLRDRLAALGEPAVIPAPTEESAADLWLGESHARFASLLDEQWSNYQDASWRQHYEGVRAKEDRLGVLEKKSEVELLDADESWERAVLLEERREPDDALAQYVAFAERFPDDSGGRYHAGRMLLNASDRAGIEHLEVSMSVDDSAIVPGCQRIVHFLEESNEADEALVESYRSRERAKQEELNAIQEERDVLTASVEYLAHEADPERVSELVSDLQQIEGVKKAWLMRKPLTLSEAPLYVLAVQRRRFTWNPMTWDNWQKDPTRDDLALQERIAENSRMPGEGHVLVMNHRGKKWKKVFTGIPGSQILS